MMMMANEAMKTRFLMDYSFAWNNYSKIWIFHRKNYALFTRYALLAIVIVLAYFTFLHKSDEACNKPRKVYETKSSNVIMKIIKNLFIFLSNETRSREGNKRYSFSFRRSSMKTNKLFFLVVARLGAAFFLLTSIFKYVTDSL